MADHTAHTADKRDTHCTAPMPAHTRSLPTRLRRRRPRPREAMTSQEGKFHGVTFEELRRDFDRRKMALATGEETHQAGPTNDAAPLLIIPYAPSRARLEDLRELLVKKLRHNYRHTGKVIILRIIKTSLAGNGITLEGEDTSGKTCQIWSMFDNVLVSPCLEAHLEIVLAIKEPYYGEDIGRLPAVRIDHPSDVIRIERHDPRVAKLFPDMFIDTSHFKAFDTALPKAQRRRRHYEALDLLSSRISVVANSKVTALAVNELKHLVYERGIMYEATGYYHLARQAADEVFLLDPDHLPALLMTHACALAQGDYESAIHYADRIEPLKPHGDERFDKEYKPFTAELHAQHVSGNYDFAHLAIDQEGKVYCASFVGNMEERDSSIAGRGMFATKSIKSGDLLLVEKPLALAMNFNPAYFPNGLKFSREEEITSKYRLALLDTLAYQSKHDPTLIPKLNSLHAGKEYNNHEKLDDVFDVHRVLSVIKHNYFLIFRGHKADQHSELHKAVTRTPEQGSAEAPTRDLGPGLWLNASKINHSCLPNVSWSWFKDIFIARAMRDIAVGEEITLSYISNTTPYEGRQNSFQGVQGFKCNCPLCQTDAMLSEEDQARRAMVTIFRHVPTLAEAAGPHREAGLDCLKAFIGDVAASYNLDTYGTIPHTELSKLMLRLGYTMLGGIAIWKDASPSNSEYARACFRACLEMTLGVRIAQHPETGYCKLIYTKYGQASPYGICALAALAELTLADGLEMARERCAGLFACARQMYLICYGEDTAFEARHMAYKARIVARLVAAAPTPQGGEWEAIIEGVVQKRCSYPEF